MSAFTSMLVPLETLTLVPLALSNTPINVLLLLFGIPIIAGIVIAVVVKLTARHHHGADDPNAEASWIGSKSSHDPILGSDNAAGQAALQGGPKAGASAGAASGDDKGGASARW